MALTLLRFGLFVVAVSLALVGGFLVLDAFIPKEQPVAAWKLFVEFTVGVAVIGLGIWVAHKSRSIAERRDRGAVTL